MARPGYTADADTAALPAAAAATASGSGGEDEKEVSLLNAAILPSLPSTSTGDIAAAYGVETTASVALLPPAAAALARTVGRGVLTQAARSAVEAAALANTATYSAGGSVRASALAGLVGETPDADFSRINNLHNSMNNNINNTSNDGAHSSAAAVASAATESGSNPASPTKVLRATRQAYSALHGQHVLALNRAGHLERSLTEARLAARVSAAEAAEAGRLRREARELREALRRSELMNKLYEIAHEDRVINNESASANGSVSVSTSERFSRLNETLTTAADRVALLCNITPPYNNSNDTTSTASSKSTSPSASASALSGSALVAAARTRAELERARAICRVQQLEAALAVSQSKVAELQRVLAAAESDRAVALVVQGRSFAARAEAERGETRRWLAAATAREGRVMGEARGLLAAAQEHLRVLAEEVVTRRNSLPGNVMVQMNAAAAKTEGDENDDDEVKESL